MIVEAARSGGVVDLRSGEDWTGERLAAETARRAALLARLPIGPGETVMVAHGGTPAFFADLFAAWHVGAAAAVVNAGLTTGEFENLIAFLDPAAVLVGEDGAGAAGAGGVRALALAREAAAADDPPTPAPTDEAAPALILFTSGTTGAPKGVVHSVRSLAARTRLNIEHIGGDALARSLCLLPTHFGHGLIGNCLTPLRAGGRLFLFPEPGVKGAALLGEMVDTNSITFMSSVPAYWRLALRVAAAPARRSLGQVHVGSAPLSADLWRQIQRWTGTDNVVNMYGITETANWAAGASAREVPPEDGLVGAMWGGRAGVLGGDGEVRAEGSGEILLDTPSVMSGYFRRDDLTAEATHDGWYRTGDLGVIDRAGTIRLTGRQKNEINRAGIKVQPEEIDLLLERHPDVAEACAFAVPDAVSGEVVGVAVRLGPGAASDAGALRRWCAERIKRESVPERWFIVDEIPKTDRGKLNRANVRAACLGGEGGP